MRAKVLMAAAAVLIGAVVKVSSNAETGAAKAAERVPVLLELFTSEGCSSCPPADKLLQKLDHEQSIAGADLIVLSEHVDYWNHDGWVDPYSSPQFSKRQQDYASLLNSEVYTPQLVIDGRRQAVGSDQASIGRLIQESERTRKTSVAVSAKKEGGELNVHIDVGASSGKGAGTVYLVLAADQARSHVMRGENAGRELEHVAVVQSLVKIASVKGDSGLQKDFRSALPPLSQGGNLRVVVFVQDAGSKRVLGVGQAKL